MLFRSHSSGHSSVALFLLALFLLIILFWYQLHTYFRYLFSELYTPDSVSVTLPDSHTILHNLVLCFHFSVAVVCPAASYSVGITFTNIVTTILLLFLLRCQSAPDHNTCNIILQTPNRNQLRISTHKKKKRCLSTAPVLLAYYVVDCFLCFAACRYYKLIITLQNFQPTLNICSRVSESLYCFDS